MSSAEPRAAAEDRVAAVAAETQTGARHAPLSPAAFVCNSKFYRLVALQLVCLGV